MLLLYLLFILNWKNRKGGLFSSFLGVLCILKFKDPCSRQCIFRNTQNIIVTNQCTYFHSALLMIVMVDNSLYFFMVTCGTSRLDSWRSTDLHQSSDSCCITKGLFCRPSSDLSGWPLFGWSPAIVKGWDWLSATASCNRTEMCVNWANGIQTLHLSLFSSLRKRHSELSASCSWPEKHSTNNGEVQPSTNTKKFIHMFVEQTLTTTCFSI